ncbi:hypothetical protein ABS774_08705, partial [Methylobacterium oxalidis]
ASAPGQIKKAEASPDASKPVKGAAAEDPAVDGHGTKPEKASVAAAEAQGGEATHGQAQATPPGQNKDMGATPTGEPDTGEEHPGAMGHGSKAETSPEKPGHAQAEAHIDASDHQPPEHAAAQGQNKASGEPAEPAGPATAHGPAAADGPDTAGGNGHGPKADAAPSTPAEASGPGNPPEHAAAHGQSKAPAASADAEPAATLDAADTSAGNGHGPKTDAPAAAPAATAAPGSAAGTDLGSSPDPGKAAAHRPTEAPGAGPHAQPGADARPGQMTATVDADGNLVFGSRSEGRTCLGPDHASPDADLHADIGLVGLAAHHPPLHHPDFH